MQKPNKIVKIHIQTTVSKMREMLKKYKPSTPLKDIPMSEWTMLDVQNEIKEQNKILRKIIKKGEKK